MKWHLARSAQYFGTGDIDVPKPTVRQLEESKAEEIAEMVFSGKLKTKAQLEKVAAQLGVDPEVLTMTKLMPKVQRALEMRVRALALEKMPEIIEAQAEKGKEDVQSATFVAKAAEVLKTGGGVTVNTGVAVSQQRQGGEPEQQVAFIERFRERQRKTLERNLEVLPESD